MEQKKYTWNKRTVEAVKKRASGSKSDKVLKDGFKEYKAVEGENKLRIMPNTWQTKPEHYGLDVHIHYGVGPDKAQYLCLERMKLNGGKCPICEEGYKPARAEWEAEPVTNKDRKEELKKYMIGISPKKQVAMWVIDRKHEDVGPQIFMMTKTMDKDFAGLGVDPTDGALIELENPEEGYDIIFTRTGKGLATEYTQKQVARRQSPLSVTEGQKWMEFINKNSLPTCFVSFSFEYIDAVYHAKLPNKPDAEEGTEEAGTETPASGQTPAQEHAEDGAQPAEVSQDEASAETPQEDVSLTYGDLASLSVQELVDFAKENAILNGVEIKIAGNNILNKLCAKMEIEVPASKAVEASAPAPSARNSYQEKLNKIKNESKASA